jgi:hypothetical protein
MTPPTELDFLLDTLDDVDFGVQAYSELSRLLIENVGPLSDLDSAALALPDPGNGGPDAAAILERIWDDFDSLGPAQQARRRLMVGVLGPKERLDTHTGGYLATFALQAGMDRGTLRRLLREFLEARATSPKG